MATVLRDYDQLVFKRMGVNTSWIFYIIIYSFVFAKLPCKHLRVKSLMMPSSCPESSGVAWVKALYGAIGFAVLITLKYFYSSAKNFQ